MNWLYSPDYVITRWPMYRALGYFKRVAVYYMRIHNEYSLTTRDQGFNYGVNSADCVIAEPTEIYQKFARFALLFFTRGTSFGISGVDTALIMPWRKWPLRPKFITTRSRFVTFPNLTFLRLITALIMRSLVHRYKNLLLAEGLRSPLRFFAFARNYVLNGRVNYINGQLRTRWIFIAVWPRLVTIFLGVDTSRHKTWILASNSRSASSRLSRR